MVNRSSEMIWVVVRRDRLDDKFDPENANCFITLREAVPTAAEADAEAERLNALNSDKKCFYFAAPVRWFADGRNVEVGYLPGASKVC